MNANILKSAICRTNVKARPNPTLFFFPGINNCQPKWDNSNFEVIAKNLEDNFEVILNEYKQLKASQIQNDYISGDHKLHDGHWHWYSYVLKGERQSTFAANCPKTAEILESCSPSKLMTKTPFSFSFFSELGKQSSIGSHFGPVNLRIRCHFPIILPDVCTDRSKPMITDKNMPCGMEIGGQFAKWELGKPIFFDDSYDHRVWNHTDQERVVLLFDLWHPDLSDDEIWAITDMFDYAKQQGWLGAKP